MTKIADLKKAWMQDKEFAEEYNAIKRDKQGRCLECGATEQDMTKELGGFDTPYTEYVNSEGRRQEVDAACVECGAN